MTSELLENGARFTAAALRDNIFDISSAAEALFDAHDVPLRAHTQLMVAIDEILVNIASYAYPDEPGDMELTVTFTEGTITMVFKDSGIAYDPLKAKDPDTTLSAEDRAIGGLGILLVKKTMDELRYERAEGKNVLTLVKRA